MHSTLICSWWLQTHLLGQSDWTEETQVRSNNARCCKIVIIVTTCHSLWCISIHGDYGALWDGSDIWKEMKHADQSFQVAPCIPYIRLTFSRNQGLPVRWKTKQRIINYVTLSLQICDWSDPQAATLRTSILVNRQNWFSVQEYNTAMFSSAAFLLREGTIMKSKWLSKDPQK